MREPPIRILGLDPGLRRTGWGMVIVDGTRLTYVSSGLVTSSDELSLAERLRELHDGLTATLRRQEPDEVAVEETFVNTNAQATLKLGHARAVALLVPALAGMPVFEYSANLIKKTVSGSGHADKVQIQAMVKFLLPKAEFKVADAADALAIAITHNSHRGAHALKRQHVPVAGTSSLAAARIAAALARN